MVVLTKIWSVITSFILCLTVWTSPAAKSVEGAELISTDTFVLEDAFYMCQGIATDGEYYYTSGSVVRLDFTNLAKYTCDGMERVDLKTNPLPAECVERGDNHIGGLSIYNGKIYAAVEDDARLYPCIVVFDCETLEATGEVYDLPAEHHVNGMPWCAIDPDTGYLYTSNWKDIETIYVYDVNNSMSPVKELDLNGIESIARIQGGEFCDGTLYLSSDTEDSGSIKNIFSVDVESGKTEIAFARDVGGTLVEAEGITFSKDENGTFMHILDFNGILGLSVNHYKIK